MITLKRNLFSLITVLLILNIAKSSSAIKCNPNEFVYGQNELIDQLLVCSLSKSFDLDLTPQGDYIKSTSRALVDQGLSNKTTILHAKLNGLWSGRRVRFLDSGWKCLNQSRTILNSVIEFTGLSLEVVERVEIPMHRNQHKLAVHKPCKTFDLPTWMCRSTKPIYRTTKTWINNAYFNLTLKQEVDGVSQRQPKIDQISLIFTCPETFKQKITHSPSSTYLLSKFVHHELATSPKTSLLTRKRRSEPVDPSGPVLIRPIEPDSSTQNGKGPAAPPYHNSVNLIMNIVSERIKSTLDDCLKELDLDLSLINDSYESFSMSSHNKYYDGDKQIKAGATINITDLKCSDKLFISQRIGLAQQAVGLGENSILDKQQVTDGSHSKRTNSQLLKYPDDPNQLLNPRAHYHDNTANMMIDDVK